METWSALKSPGRWLHLLWTWWNTVGQPPPTPGTPNHHRLLKLHTGLQLHCTLSLSALPPYSRTLISKWNAKCISYWKDGFGPPRGNPEFFSSLAKTLVTLSLVQDQLDIRKEAVVSPFLKTSARSGSMLSQLLVKFWDRPLLIILSGCGQELRSWT